ncbi:hypothetical protein MKEN_00393100 [Mycena kentingensis (nom. inval.)]|nr:hypothetical protein MKEN_00393100 [Mycena kentingensis (nom. inval.)]
MAELGLEQSQPLLDDIEAQNGPARASVKREGDSGNGEIRISVRGTLFKCALVLCAVLFLFSIISMAQSFKVGELFVCLWSALTIGILFTLIAPASPKGKQGQGYLGKTMTQIQILCLLTFSWIPIVTGAIIESTQACSWRGGGCGLTIWIDVLVWITMFCLVAAAYATYRRAARVHGTKLVPLTGMVPAWRISDVPGEEGYGQGWAHRVHLE